MICLSRLQKHILITCFQAKGKVPRTQFHGFYDRESHSSKSIVDAITKTLERMMDRGFLIGHGIRTPQKWYIKEVKLTPLGRRLAKTLQGTQQKLPLNTSYDYKTL